MTQLPSIEIAALSPAYQRDALQMIFRSYRRRRRLWPSLRLVTASAQATRDTFKTSLHAGHSVQQVLQNSRRYGGVLAVKGHWQ